MKVRELLELLSAVNPDIEVELCYVMRPTADTAYPIYLVVQNTFESKSKLCINMKDAEK